MAYEEQVYEPLMGGNVNYNFDMSQPGADEELRKLQALLRGEKQVPDTTRAPMGLEEALDLRRIQSEAQGWSAPVIYPDVMPSPTGSQPPMGVGKAGQLPDYRGASQVGGYAGPTRESDRPFDFGIELKATPSGVDVGDAEKMQKLFQMPLPNQQGPVKTVGQLQSLLQQMKGQDKDVIEGVVAALTGIDPEARRTKREQDVARFKQGLPMSSYESAVIEKENARLKMEEQTKKHSLINALAQLSKGMGEALKDPLLPPDQKLKQQADFNKLNSIIAQAGVDLLRNERPVVPRGQPGANPPPAGAPPPPTQLPGGITVTRTDKTEQPGAAVKPAQPEPYRGGSAGYRASTEGKAQQAGELHVEQRAKELAANDNKSWYFLPEMAKQHYRERAARFRQE